MATTYRIYTTRALEHAIDPLVTQKRNKGYVVEVRFVDDLSDPKYTAIRAQVLQDRPDSVLLVGDCDRVPGYPLEDRHVSPSVRFDSDAYYGTPDNSYVPTIATGRISSDDPATVKRVCEALVSYPPVSWTGAKQNVVLTGWIPTDPADPVYPQDAAVQCLKEAGHYLHCWFEFERSGSASRQRRWGADDSTKASLINAINNRGAAIVRYLGHGASTAWDNIGNNENFDVSDVDNIRTEAKPPLIISATCMTGDVDASPSLAEKWQLTGKAVGVWAADTSSDTYFNDRVTQAIFHQIVTRRERCVGRILLGALQHMTVYTAGRTTAEEREFFQKTFLMYRYLGDPDTILAVPTPCKTTLAETSTNGPALATTYNKLLIGWTGDPNLRLNFMSSTDGVHWSNKVTLAETSPESPALCRFGSEFVVAWTGEQNHLINIMHSADGQHWDGKITLNERTWSPPALSSFGGKLYLAWRGGPTNNLINVLCSSDARSWTDKKVLDLITPSGPALTATASNVILVWRGGPTNNLLNIVISSDGQSFRSKHTLTDATACTPALINYLGRPMLAWAGAGNQQLNVMEGNETRSRDDIQWGAKITWPEECKGGPSLARLGKSLVCAWTGTDKRLNTMLYPVAL